MFGILYRLTYTQKKIIFIMHKSYENFIHSPIGICNIILGELSNRFNRASYPGLFEILLLFASHKNKMKEILLWLLTLGKTRFVVMIGMGWEKYIKLIITLNSVIFQKSKEAEVLWIFRSTKASEREAFLWVKAIFHLFRRVEKIFWMLEMNEKGFLDVKNE